MDRSTSGGGYSPHTSGMSPLSNPTIGASVENTAQSAHQTLDKVSGKTAEQVERLTGTAHRAVDRAADVAGSALEQARVMQTRATEAACETIRARPIASVLGALVAGYLLGRLARL